jgi:hypothetical protein
MYIKHDYVLVPGPVARDVCMTSICSNNGCSFIYLHLHSLPYGRLCRLLLFTCVLGLSDCAYSHRIYQQLLVGLLSVTGPLLVLTGCNRSFTSVALAVTGPLPVVQPFPYWCLLSVTGPLPVLVGATVPLPVFNPVLY